MLAKKWKTYVTKSCSLELSWNLERTTLQNSFTKGRRIINITLKISLTCCREVKNVLHFAGKIDLFLVAINNRL